MASTDILSTLDSSVATAFALSPKDHIAGAFIDQHVQAAQKIRDPLEPGWGENWANYRVEPFFKNQVATLQLNPYANWNAAGYNDINSLKTPESHQGINTLMAVLMAAIYGPRDYVRAEPRGDEDVDAASKVSQLVMYGLERPGGYYADYATLKDALIFSTGTQSVGWDTVTRTVPRRLPVMDRSGQPLLDPETGQPLTLIQNVTIPVYDDIRRASLSQYDIWFDAGATRLSEALGIVERTRFSKDTLRALRKAPGWNAEAINRVLSSSPGDPWPMGAESPKLMIEGLSREDTKHVASFGYYGAWKYSGMLPSEVARALGLDPLASNLLVLVNGCLIFAGQSPQRNGELPYNNITILPTGGTIYGLSPLTVIRYLQDVSDTQLILTVQAMIEAVYQNYTIGGAAGVGPAFARDLERRRPRQAFMVAGDISQIAPLQKDYSGLQIATGALALLSETMRNAMNARDPVQGIQQKTGDTTATEVSTVAQAALQNADQLAILIERDELPRLAHLIHDLYLMNLPDEGAVIRRIGDSEATKIPLMAIDGEFDIQFVGARMSQSKQAKAQQLIQYADVVTRTPIGAASFDYIKHAQMLGDLGFDMKGLESLIISDPNEVIARLQAAGINGPLAGPSAPPEGPGGGE